MSTERSLFIKNVTLLDFAWLTAAGPKGQSYQADLVCIGDTDSSGMVMDFSVLKALAKKILDTQFDHKLWVKRSQVVPLLERYQESDLLLVSNTPPGATFCKTSFALLAPQENFCMWSNDLFMNEEDQTRLNIKAIEKRLSQAVLAHCSGNIRKVYVTLNDHESLKKPNYFSYTHSLPCHLGNCQRYHGHSYVVEVFKNRELDEPKSQEVAQKIHDSYFIKSSYLRPAVMCEKSQKILNILNWKNVDLSLLRALYQGTQGEFLCLLPDTAVVALEQESTIENLAENIHSQFRFGPEFTVVAYEGLGKGSMFPSQNLFGN